MKKKSSPHHPKLKRKKLEALWVHAEPSHWQHEISISKTVCHHFWPWLIPPIINWGFLFLVVLKWVIGSRKKKMVCCLFSAMTFAYVSVLHCSLLPCMVSSKFIGGWCTFFLAYFVSRLPRS
jgi:hypothetical protein